MLNGNFAIRVAITKHGSKRGDFEMLINLVLDKNLTTFLNRKLITDL